MTDLTWYGAKHGECLGENPERRFHIKMKTSET